MAKKITRIALFAVLIAAIVLLAYGCSALSSGNFSDVYLDRVIITARMNADGSLSVSEQWDAVFKSLESKRNLYKELNLYDISFGSSDSEIIDFGVYDNDTGKSYRYLSNPDDPATSNANQGVTDACYIYGTSTSKEIGCYFSPISRGKKSVTFNYTLTNVVALYEDTAVLYWKPFSTDFTLKIKDFSAKIYLPSESPIAEDDLVFMHCEAAGSYYGVSQNAFEYSAPEVPSGIMIETRILMDKSYFDDSLVFKQSTEAVRADIIDEEKAWFDDWNARIKLQDTVYIIGIVFFALAVLGGLAFAVYSLFFYARYNKEDYPPYVRDVPEGYSAAEMGYFYYYYDGGGFAKANKGKLISATIMELCRRGFVSIEASPTDDKFRISVLSVPEARFTELKPHEKVIYDLLAQVGNFYGGAFTMKQFEKYSSDHYIYVGNCLTDFDRCAGNKLKNGDYITRKGASFIRSAPKLGIGLVIASVVLYFGMAFFLFGAMGLFALGLSLIMFAPRAARLNENGVREYASSKAFAQYMLDFSNLKEYEIPALAIWEEYMVYATMMGISERVVKELKARYPELASASDTATPYYRNHNFLFTYLWLNSVCRFDFGAHLGQCVNAVSGTVNMAKRAAASAAAAKKFGGSGGFGRGGGGFGGGGGGFGGGGGGAR